MPLKLLFLLILSFNLFAFEEFELEDDNSFGFDGVSMGRTSFHSGMKKNVSLDSDLSDDSNFEQEEVQTCKKMLEAGDHAQKLRYYEEALEFYNEALVVLRRKSDLKTTCYETLLKVVEIYLNKDKLLESVPTKEDVLTLKENYKIAAKHLVEAEGIQHDVYLYMKMGKISELCRLNGVMTMLMPPMYYFRKSIICAYQEEKREKKKDSERCCECLLRMIACIFKKNKIHHNHFTEPLKLLKKREKLRGNLLRFAQYNSFLSNNEMKK